MKTESLRRGQAPFLLPVGVEVAGQVSLAALTALAKRVLYQPAQWPEELDDRTSIRGALSLTFAGSLPSVQPAPAVLLLRAKRGQQTPICSIHGPLKPLGHDFDRRGWQPFILPLNTELIEDMTVEININAPLSRALLGRGD